MKITLKKEKLLYDISNLAYVISDTGETDHKLHQVADICESGNIDRVARILGLAYAKVQSVLSPVLNIREVRHDYDFSVIPRNYVFHLRDKILSYDRILKIKETAYEYMVCMVLKDWLQITLPTVSGVWQDRAERCLEALEGMAGVTVNVVRRVPPM